jgi:O-acetylhomoserine (thiol)-lyase
MNSKFAMENNKNKSIMSEQKLHFETLQVHAGQEEADPATDSRAVPIYQTTSYVFRNCQQGADRFGLREPGNIYGRLTNTTQGVLEERIAALEGGVGALALASGAAAVTYALENIVCAGGHIVFADNVYGGTYNLIEHTLSNFGITSTVVNPRNFAEVEEAIRPETRVIYAETLGNPNSDVADIDALAEIAHRHGLPLFVDNTFGTPYLIRPIEHGADIVIHSATKFIGGHGSTLGGVIVDGGNFDWKANADKFPTLAKPDPSYHGAVFAEVAGRAAFVTRARAVVLRDQGATLAPIAAWILLQGLETLSLRVERQVSNALKIVDFLEKCPKVTRVNHPSVPTHPDHELYKKLFPQGAGSIFTFDIKGGKDEAWKFIDSLRIFSLLANVADVKSLVIHPATTTHSQLSLDELESEHIYPSTIRLSIGTEHVDDLIGDLRQAFEKI